MGNQQSISEAVMDVVNKSTTDVTGTIDVMGQTVPITSKIITATTIKAI